ncbi:hypothetical protein Hamer_G007443 [Homarus americanus]|uniref:Uncharacterized protein n=1 Tax=Homarus americanus TaxID=6706 RepID=A0A8J5MSB2_HOMAM|nr:hypothetical protein Hamer_G007443 [Homarus americanus]
MTYPKLIKKQCPLPSHHATCVPRQDFPQDEEEEDIFGVILCEVYDNVVEHREGGDEGGNGRGNGEGKEKEEEIEKEKGAE